MRRRPVITTDGIVAGGRSPIDTASPAREGPKQERVTGPPLARRATAGQYVATIRRASNFALPNGTFDATVTYLTVQGAAGALLARRLS